MNKKGFTLVELLAVIVILAIIALIATPIVLNVINKAQEAADARSVEAYGKAWELKYQTGKVLDNSGTLSTATPEIDTDYSGDVVTCSSEGTTAEKLKLTDCTVGGRTVKYTYENGKVSKQSQTEA